MRAIISCLCAVFQVIFLAVSTAVAGGVVGSGAPASCTEGALDNALAGGGQIAFDCGPDPVTITLTGEKIITTLTSIDGGSLITLSGGAQTRLFHMQGDPNLELLNLTIADGMTTGEGAGVYMDDLGTLVVVNCRFERNISMAAGGMKGGGAISSTADLHWGTGIGSTISVQDSYFSENRAGNGGAISSGNSGILRITGTTFSLNVAIETGPFEGGGAIINKGYSVAAIENCLFDGNQGGSGGAVHVLHANLSIRDSIFRDNVATTVNDLMNGGGGAMYVDEGDPDHNGIIEIERTLFIGNSAHSHGGAVFYWAGANGTFMIDDCSFSNNSVLGAGQAGIGQGGAIWYMHETEEPLIVLNSTFAENRAFISGGAVWVNVPAYITNATFYRNEANNPNLPPEDWRRGFGGAIDGGAGVVLTNCTIVDNRAGFAGGGIAAGGTNSTSELVVRNTIIARNTGDNPWGIQQNCTRRLTDEGNNIQFPQRQTTLDNDYECLQGQGAVDPLTGTAGDYGGWTDTVPLLSGSPAIDRGNDLNCPARDQRGALRVDGDGDTITVCDIGAYEFGASPDALLRDDSIGSLEPAPDLSTVFPLDVYREPAPALPFTDEPGLLTDASRPLVFYQYRGSAISVISLVSDKTPGILSVSIYP
ncbi:choice-of-anchor Q domain-containing protein [Acidobacteriota bacterium]